MDCASEVSLIQEKFDGLRGISDLKFNIENRILTVNFDSKAIKSDEIQNLLSSIGLKSSVIHSGIESGAGSKAAFIFGFWRLAVAGFLAIAGESIELFSEEKFKWAIPIICISSIFLSGFDVYKKGFVALSKGILNINALMSIAVTGAIIIRQWPEAAMVMFLFAVAELIEAKAFDRARTAFKKLMDLAPDITTVQGPDSKWEDRPTKDVRIDSLVRTRPGERISLDGIIVKGATAINQAPITGESMPVEKVIGDKVFAGTINESSEIEFRTTAESTNSTLAKIVDIVDTAQSARAPTQRFIDRFSRVYTPAVFFVAIGVGLIPPLMAGGAWYDWIYKALVLLVIACPCALVISTPVTIVSGLSGAAKNGILIKGGAYIEAGAKLKIVALDKTGTITHGKPMQTDFRLLDDADTFAVRSIAASLASRSDHPVSQAIANRAEEDGISLKEVVDFTALPGRGSKGFVQGQQYFLANHRLIEELGICSPLIENLLEGYEREGKTVAILADGKRVLAIMGVIDTIRETSRQAIQELHNLGLQTVMLSGDNQLTAEKIATEVGIDRAHGHLLPEGKVGVVNEYRETGLSIGMVGDGINDAPALATADVGFSMGVAGTDVAIETSDVAIMDDDLRKIPQFILLSRKTRRLLFQNIALAIGIKFVFFVLTMLGISSMWMAVFADTGASLLVVLNGLRVNK
jgi:Cd2+/Zn2+-exporting ATPase